MSKAVIQKAKSQVYETPDSIWNEIEKVWGIPKDDFFDPCPINPTFNGLLIPWKKFNYVNPPFLKDTLELFVIKAIGEACSGNKTIMLLPSKTDQEWFHTLVKNNYKIHWIRGRIKFKDQTSSIQIPCFLVEIA